MLVVFKKSYLRSVSISRSFGDTITELEKKLRCLFPWVKKSNLSAEFSPQKNIIAIYI